LVAAFALAMPGSLLMADTTFSWSSTVPISGGTAPISGNAVFSITPDAVSGYDLMIALTNTSTSVQTLTAEVLTGLFFNIVSTPGQGALTMLSAAATDGLINTTGTNIVSGSQGSNICAPNSSLVSCSTTLTGGWEAAYNPAGFLGNPNGLTPWGIGTAGFGVFNGGSVGNSNYGVVSTAGIDTSANNGFKNSVPFSYETATFVLRGLTTNQVTINNVSAAYGTLPEAIPAGQLVVTAIPEPGTFSLAGVLALLACVKFRRRAAR
jgi:hypothetical protein